MKIASDRAGVVLTMVVLAVFFIAGCGGQAGGSPSSTTTATAGSPGAQPTPTPSGSGATVPQSSHVVLVIEENHTFAEVYPHGMPWLSAQGNSYGFTANYHADVPGSALDYFWLSSGSGESAFGCQGWGCPMPITSDNIFRELNNAGLSWKVYADSLPSVGYMGGDVGAYLERHNPAKWYSDVISNAAQQKKMVPFTQFAADLAANQLPNYSVIIPDANHDAHNGTLTQADTWLQANVAPLLNQPYFQPGGDGLLLVTFDECDGAVGACPELVFTALIGPKVKRGFQSLIPYKHENALRTMLEALGVTVHPGASKTAVPMADFF
jgi:acid phosphatase